MFLHTNVLLPSGCVALVMLEKGGMFPMKEHVTPMVFGC